MSWHVEEPVAGQKCCSAGSVALLALHLGSGELEGQRMAGGCWLRLLVKQAGTCRDGQWVLGCCNRSLGSMGGRVGVDVVAPVGWQCGCWPVKLHCSRGC